MVDANLVFIPRLCSSSSSPILAYADKINVGVDNGSQQSVLGMLKHLVSKLGRVAELARSHWHCLYEEHLIQILIFGVNLAAVGHLLALHGVDQGQHMCVVPPHAFQDLFAMGGSHVVGAATGWAATSTGKTLMCKLDSNEAGLIPFLMEET